VKIPEYFTDDEIHCPCGCGLLPDFEFMRKLYIFRMLVDEPIYPTSVARCPAYNQSIGGAVGSAHLKGACDIGVTKEKEYRCTQAALKAGFNGIGFSDNKFMHLDDKHNPPAIWTY
jgi:hypothetical protein